MITSRRICGALAAVCAGLVLAGAPGAAPPGIRVIHVERFAFPTAIANGYGSVWVAEHRGYHLNRINPRTNKIVKKILLPVNVCGAIALGAGGVWVSDCVGETGVAQTLRPTRSPVPV